MKWFIYGALLGLLAAKLAFADFISTDPVTDPATPPQPAIPEIVYDKLWMNKFTATAYYPTAPARIEATFIPYAVVNGVQYAKANKVVQKVVIPDLWTEINSIAPERQQSIGGQVYMMMQGLTTKKWPHG